MKRTIFIGDVHGCVDELDELLERTAYGADDRLCFVGDLVARGPDTQGVLDRVRELDGIVVRGNHEERILAAHRAKAQGKRGPRLGPAHHRLLRELGEVEFEYMAGLPLSYELPDHNIRLVHGGVLPGLPFERQSSWTLMHIRSINDDGSPSDKLGEETWAASYQEGPHIVFGHDSRRRLQLHENATGIDTGCVYGGKLTAIVLEANQQMPPVAEREQLMVVVDAHAQYYSGVKKKAV